jgi:ribose transport system substrate-binding protein
VVFKASVIDKSNYQAADVPAEKRSCPAWDEAIKG